MVRPVHGNAGLQGAFEERNGFIGATAGVDHLGAVGQDRVDDPRDHVLAHASA